MLPLLPALLLLLLQGSSDFERLAAEGRLPSALEKFVSESPNEHKSLQSFWVVSGHPELSRALAVLLAVHPEPDSKPSYIPPPTDEVEVIPAVPVARPLPEGYVEGRRTRDGPSSLASAFA